MSEYNEADFVAYALSQMDLEVITRNGKYFNLKNGFDIEVEKKDLYRLSKEGWVISPFDDIGQLIEFIKKNEGHAED
ncbi:hypothetical protein [Jiulongibacter sediminis]|uniref:Uncharacterized protein n=1 Tax=Jiulongibacter sediminis TaxID=1605367 RepID=A0A0P7C4X0_9BACT|nr:hypothetical protein [Jiulongibacter sediminis]KPM49741.1 hypothetical protein AFM12_03940 [Jiulongibacter sediminis]TBX26777.1 hypothetical protein TK44_03945 [Jiulongibacter sediminis]